MKHLVELKKIFKVTSGNKLDLNKLKTTTTAGKNTVNFVSRTSRNMGVSAQVNRVEGIEPFKPGLITVALGGSILSTNMQPKEFYTGQNVSVLEPLDPNMPLEEILYYCSCIEANKFRYSAFGREANRTLRYLKVPSRNTVPSWVTSDERLTFAGEQIQRLIEDDRLNFMEVEHGGSIEGPELVALKDLFEIRNGTNVENSFLCESRLSDNYIPYVRPSKFHDGAYVKFVNTEVFGRELMFPPNTLYVSTNGQGSHSHAYVSSESFIPNSDISVLIPKREMAIFEKIYYAEIITANRWLFSYGRKPKGERLAKIKVPKELPASILKVAEINNINNLRDFLLPTN